MPSPPYAKLLASIAGGGATSGGLTATNGQSAQLSAESTAFWSSALWEIFSFPSSGFAVPAGWTDNGNGNYSFSGIGPPPSFTLPSSPTWGKFLFRLTVNGGLTNGVADPNLKDEATAIEILSPIGLHDLAWAETSQYSSQKKWAKGIQDNLRTLDTRIAAGGAPGASNTALVVDLAGVGSMTATSPQTLWSYSIPAQSMVDIEFHVFAIRADATNQDNASGQIRRAVWRRIGTGVATQVGTTDTFGADKSDAGISLTVTINTDGANAARLQVNTASGQTLRVSAHMFVRQVTR